MDNNQEAAEASSRIVLVSQKSGQMEDRDGEMQISQPLKVLLQALHGDVSQDTQPIESIPCLTSEEYGDIFYYQIPPSIIRSKLRLEILEAVGHCKTLKNFNTTYLNSCELRNHEWKAVLQGLQSNLVLEEVVYYPLASVELEAEVAPYWSDVFRSTQTLTKLTIGEDCRSQESKLRPSFASALASGLEANPHPPIEELKVYDWHHVGVSIYLSRVICSLPRLSKLSLSGICKLSEDEFAGMSDALGSSKKLQTLQVQDAEVDFARVLVSAFTRSHADHILTELSLTGRVEGLLDALPDLCSGRITTISLSYDVWEHTFKLSLDQRQRLGISLRESKVLREFRIRILIGDRQDSNLLDASPSDYDGFYHPTHDILPKTTLQICLNCTIPSRVTSLLLENYLQSPRLEALEFVSDSLNCFSTGRLYESINRNGVVKKLSFYGCSKFRWDSLFQSLKENTSVRYLEFRYCEEFSTEDYIRLTEILQFNFTLESINVDGTSWAHDWRASLLQMVLQRNVQLGEALSFLKDRNMPFDSRAKPAKVLVCKSSKAGDIQPTMMKTVNAMNPDRRFSICNKAKKAVSTLRRGRNRQPFTSALNIPCKSEDTVVQVWDISGPGCTHYLPVVYPMSAVGTELHFVFIFSPFDLQNGTWSLKDQVYEIFGAELKKLIQLIISKPFVLDSPRILAVLTHKTLLQEHGSSFDPNVVLNILTSLREEFPQCILEGRNQDELLLINTDDEDDVKLVLDSALQFVYDYRMATPLTLERPKSCSAVASRLAKLSAEIMSSPIWSLYRFHKFCVSRDSALKRWLRREMEGQKLLRAVDSFLEEMGAIIVIPRSPFIEAAQDLVVMDDVWLLRDVLGELENVDPLFQPERGIPYDHISDSRFVTVAHMRGLVAKLLKLPQSRGRKVEFEMIEQILLYYKLCFKVRAHNWQEYKYYIPAICDEGY
ncbi:hypothetical protein Mapa_008092 [Marchantia paleacea]|nr:hypothetical protein Mapa_008092 [Marchantia paleacea]